MPEARDAKWLVDRTRFHVGEYDTGLLRDGFDADRGQADRAILPAINEAITDLILLGQYKCRFNLSVESGVSEYRLDAGIGTVRRATISGMPMKKTRMTTLDRFRPGWGTPEWQNAYGYNPGDPIGSEQFEYYNDIPDVIGIFPTPLWTDPTGTGSVEFIAQALADDLTEEGNVPQRLPSMYHDYLPLGAACKILASMGRPQDMEKLAVLEPRWQAACKAIGSQANNIEEDESYQVAPYSYRDHYRSDGGDWW